MTVDVGAIARERLDRWKQDCVGDHVTPMLMVAVGHDHVSGAVHVYTLEDIPDRDLVLFLTAVLRGLRGDPEIELHRG